MIVIRNVFQLKFGKAQKGYAQDIREEGFAPLQELMDNFAKAGGKIYVCSPCFAKRKLDDKNLVAGASLVDKAGLPGLSAEQDWPSRFSGQR